MSLGYLLASLPMLFADRAPAITVEAFVSACEGAVAAADAAAAQALARGEQAPNHVYGQRWQALEAAIEGAIGRKRIALRAGQAAGDFAAPQTPLCPVWLTRMVETAFETAADPLAREDALLQTRWAAAEEMGGVDPMGRGQLFAYAVKLHLCSQRAAREISRGRERLEAALPKQTL